MTGWNNIGQFIWSLLVVAVRICVWVPVAAVIIAFYAWIFTTFFIH